MAYAADKKITRKFFVQILTEKGQHVEKAS